MRAALLSLLLSPTAPLAQNAASYARGVPIEDSTQSVVTAPPCDAPCAIVVRFDNTLVTTGPGAPAGAPPVVRASLALGGVRIGVVVEHGGGQVPDLLRVLPPPGYSAEPAEVLVDDDASASVRVVPVPMS